MHRGLLSSGQLNENLLERRDGHTVPSKPELRSGSVQVPKESRKLGGRIERQAETQFIARLGEQLDARDETLQLPRDLLRVHLCVRLDHRESIPESEAALQKESRAAATHLSGAHDRDAIGEHVGLIHVVGREHECAPLLIALQQLPHAAARAGVHPRRWLIEQHCR